MKFFAFVLAALMALTPMLGAAGPEDSGSYFLVIDHSGSMLTKISKGPQAGRTRWGLMRERASGFVDRLPERSNVWSVIFSAGDPANPGRDWRQTFGGRLETAENRINLSAALSNYPEPALSNGTWLYDAEMEALEQVEITGARNPDAYMTVMVYTDGVDEGAGRRKVEMAKNPSSKTTREELTKRISQLRERHHNLNVVNVYRPGDEVIRDAHVVRLATNRLQLASPLVIPKQVVELRFAFRDDQLVKLEGLPLAFEIESVDGSPLPLKISGGPFRLTNGGVRLTLEKTGDWPSGQDVRARIKVVYPENENIFLVAEGGDLVDVFIQGAKAPAIRDLLPADESSFPVGREMAFSLTTLPGCEVEWNFGDGGSSRGNPVKHIFQEPGKREVNVKVTDPRSGLSAAAKISVNPAELRLILDPLPVDVVPGREVTLSAASTGTFRRFEWRVAGRKHDGKPLAGGGTSLTLAFLRPGPLEISVVGEGIHGGRAETERATLLVKEVPAIRLTSPAAGESLYFGSTRELRAEVEGVDANQVRFLLTANGKELVPAREVDVRREGSVRVALLPLPIPTLATRIQAMLKVETIGISPPQSREVPVILESEPSSIEIKVSGGREPFIHRDTPLEVQVHGKAAIRDIRWDFGDGLGWVDGNQVERHTWKRYGDFTVKALANGPDGTALEANPVEIKVPVRAVKVEALITCGGRKLGVDISKVEVNSEIDLNAQVEGDAIRTRWILDESELPQGQKSITIKKRGFHTIQLIADATPEAGGQAAVTITREIRTSDKMLFYVAVIGEVVALYIFGRLLLGNKWRFAEFHVTKDGRNLSAMSDGGVYRAKPIFATGSKSKKFCGRWNPWTKKIVLRMREIDAIACPNWPPDAMYIITSRKDLKIVAGTGLRNRELSDGLQQLDRRELPEKWFRGWTFVRTPFANNHPNRVGGLTLKLQANKPGILGYWPEALFTILVALFIVATRIIGQNLN